MWAQRQKQGKRGVMVTRRKGGAAGGREVKQEREVLEEASNDKDDRE